RATVRRSGTRCGDHRVERLMRRSTVGTILLACLGCAAVTGCASAGQAAGGLTAAQRGFAVAAAHREAAQFSADSSRPEAWPRNVDAVTGRAAGGTIVDSNTGHPCASGTVITVDLLGDFDTAVSPAPGAADTAVHAVILNVDARTGQVCLLSVRTGSVRADPDADLLFRR
ncbi:MAG: hypothetical protein ACRDOD_07840, partial [Streptosporangiaceae bacterium]